MTRRSRGREVALQVLYQVEQNPGIPPEEIHQFIQRRLLAERKLCEFTEGLIAGVKEHQVRLDAMISQVAENWRLDRMAAIDRNILRLGAFEMLFCPDVPAKVAINEALELAKRYSTAQSSRFVNGILDRVLQWQVEESKPEPEGEPAKPETEAQAEPAPIELPRDETKTESYAPAASPSSPRVGADLHVHTTHSDGVCSPCEVVVAAARVGLSALAITDHDTVSALAVARPEAARWGVELIAGVELTCVYNDREFHILGHFIRDDDPALVAAMAALRDGRVRRVEAMAARLEALGLSIDLEALRRAFPRATLGRRHLADYLTRTRQAASMREVFTATWGTEDRPASPSPGSTLARRSP